MPSSRPTVPVATKITLSTSKPRRSGAYMIGFRGLWVGGPDPRFERGFHFDHDDASLEFQLPSHWANRRVRVTCNGTFDADETVRVGLKATNGNGTSVGGTGSVDVDPGSDGKSLAFTATTRPLSGVGYVRFIFMPRGAVLRSCTFERL